MLPFKETSFPSFCPLFDHMGWRNFNREKMFTLTLNLFSGYFLRIFFENEKLFVETKPTIPRKYQLLFFSPYQQLARLFKHLKWTIEWNANTVEKTQTIFCLVYCFLSEPFYINGLFKCAINNRKKKVFSFCGCKMRRH